MIFGKIFRKNKHIMSKLEEVWERLWENRTFFYSENIVIKGDRNLFGRGAIFSGEAGITIEEYVQIGFNAVILSNSTIDNLKASVVLRKNCRVGANSVIMPGVEIGENSIIGACSIVPKFTKIPPNEIWVGIPARKLKDLSKK